MSKNKNININKNIFFKKGLALAAAFMMMLSYTACGKDKKEPASSLPEAPADTTALPEEIKEPSEFTAPTFSGKIAEAKAKNEDIKGWLQIPDTKIDGAVVQAKDNTFYWRRNEWKEYSYTGSYFADYQVNLTDRDSLNKNTIIYGHNVDFNDDKDKERFSQLLHFADIDFAKTHPYVFFSLENPNAASTPSPSPAPDAEATGASANPESEMVWQVFSAFYTTTDFDYIQVHKDPMVTDVGSEELTEAQLVNIATEAKLRSEYNYDVDVSGTDKILTLSTCSYKYGRRNDVRFVVMAKLLDQDACLKNNIDLTENTSKKEIK